MGNVGILDIALELSSLQQSWSYEASGEQQHTQPLAADLHPHTEPVPTVCQPMGCSLQAL